MKYRLLALIITLFGCEATSFNGDARQLLAMQKIESLLPPNSSGFAIQNFREEEITPSDSTLAKSLTRYNFQIAYTDSAGTLVRTNAYALFAPNGTTILNAAIIHHP